MACGKTLGTLSAFKRVTVLSTSTYQFFPTTDWMPLTGLEVRAWLNMLDESSDGVEAIPAYQTATVVTDQKSTNGGRGDWAAISGTVTAIAASVEPSQVIPEENRDAPMTASTIPITRDVSASAFE